MAQTSTKAAVRHLCYAALPLAAALIVPSLVLMPNHKHDTALHQSDVTFQIGFVFGLVGVALALAAVLVLLLGSEE